MSERSDIYQEIDEERDRQDAKFGDQSGLPDGTRTDLKWHADSMREKTERKSREGKLTWRHILDEEVAEAGAEQDLDRLRTELVQTAAVSVAWIEAIDRRRTQD